MYVGVAWLSTTATKTHIMRVMADSCCKALHVQANILFHALLSLAIVVKHIADNMILQTDMQLCTLGTLAL